MKDNNYYETFIEVAEDCRVEIAEVPRSKGDEKSIPVLQYEMVANYPYCYTQEDVLFEVHATRKKIQEEQRQAEREKFFEKPQPCLRTSSLGKRYGWGIHHNTEGKIALILFQSQVNRTV